MIKNIDKHRIALERIVAQPYRYGIKNVIASAIEPTLFTPYRQTIAQPDIVFYTSNMDIYLIEYKSNGNNSLIKKAEKQLSNAAD